MEKGERMNRFGRKLMAAVVTSSLIVTPVMAAPSVDDLKDSKAAAQSEVNSLQAQLKEVAQSITETEDELVKTGEEITQTTEDLKEAEEAEKEQYEAMKLRIKYMYENGGSDVLEALLSSENFADLTNKAEYVQNVHSYDREKLEEYVETKEKVAALKTSLEEEQKKLEKKEAEFTAQQEELDTMISEKSSEIADLQGQIDDAIAEAAREAEEKRQQEEAARQQQAVNNSSSDNKSNSSSDSSGSNSNSNSDSSGDKGNSGTTSGSKPSYVAGSAVSRAYSALGKPYSWGAVGPDSFDCSGLVSFCLTGRYARVYTSGSFAGYPAVSDPQPGDVCYKPGHVGIYIGNGQMIHAPQTGDVVKISKVHSGMKIVRP